MDFGILEKGNVVSFNMAFSSYPKVLLVRTSTFGFVNDNSNIKEITKTNFTLNDVLVNRLWIAFEE